MHKYQWPKFREIVPIVVTRAIVEISEQYGRKPTFLDVACWWGLEGWPIAFAREKGTKRGTYSQGDHRNAVVSSLGSAATPSRRTRRNTLCSTLLRLFDVSNLVLALCAVPFVYTVIQCRALSFTLFFYKSVFLVL